MVPAKFGTSMTAVPSAAEHVRSLQNTCGRPPGPVRPFRSLPRFGVASKPAGPGAGGDSRAEAGDDTTGGKVVLDVAFATECHIVV